MREAFPFSVVPPLPSASKLGAKLSLPLDFLDRFTPEFILKRQGALSRYLNRVASHSLLAQCPALEAFLSGESFVSVASILGH